MNFFFILLFSIISMKGLNTASASSAIPVRPARLIINTFGAQCPQVIPRVVGSSLVNLDSLYGAVQELKNSNECNSVGQMSNVLASYSGLFQDYSTKQGEDQTQLKLENEVALYTQLLSNSVRTPAQLTYVQDQIVRNQTNLVNVKAGLTRFQDFSGRESRGAN